MLALITGWFSFEDGHATAGDLLAAEVLQGWLDEKGVRHHTAAPKSLGGEVDWREVEPADYEVVIFVCGPFEKKRYEAALFKRFADCRLIGIDLSMAQPIDDWNPFDVLLERDSPATGRPELVFSAPRRPVPLVAVCLVEDYEGGLTAPANHAIARLLDRSEAARIDVDTRLPGNLGGLRSQHEVEAVLAKVDVVVTTRLHGMVFALKNGVPALPIDPAAGGGKIVRQAQTIGWPISFPADSLTEARLDEAFRFCLSDQARSQARECATRAVGMLDGVRSDFLAALDGEGASRTAPALRRRSRAELAELLLHAPVRASRFSLRTVLGRWARSRSAPRTGALEP